MTAGAPKGNTNAEKWDLKKARELFDKALKLAQQKCTYLDQDDDGNEVQKESKQFEYDFIGEVARDLGHYKEIFTYLSGKFPQLEHQHKKLLTILEANCFSNSKKGYTKEATAIVNLKANHKWKDRQDLTTDDKPIEQPLFGPLTPEKK